VSTHKPAIDVNVPMGKNWFDFVLEETGLSVNDVKKLYDGDSDFAEIENPVATLFHKYAAARFDTPGVVDPAWNEPVGVVTAPEKKRGNKAVRYEVSETSDGARCSKGFDEKGELISFRILYPEVPER
jgi:hypothetical protein